MLFRERHVLLGVFKLPPERMAHDIDIHHGWLGSRCVLLILQKTLLAVRFYQKTRKPARNHFRRTTPLCSGYGFSIMAKNAHLPLTEAEAEPIIVQREAWNESITNLLCSDRVSALIRCIFLLCSRHNGASCESRISPVHS